MGAADHRYRRGLGGEGEEVHIKTGEITDGNDRKLELWSFDPDYRIGSSDVAWVAEQLRKNGGREAWEPAEESGP